MSFNKPDANKLPFPIYFFLTKQTDFSCVVIFLGKAQSWRYIHASIYAYIFNVFIIKANSGAFQLCELKTILWLMG